ncbi:MAG: transcription termination/antitermination protein NusA [Paraprevotella sp.]|nr:transcription termination/antitermination protein NusA [Paraprevotella sp.]
MAKKAETINLIDTFAEFKETKNIDRATLVSVLEESFRSVIAKMFGSDDNYDVIVNPDKGDFEIYRNRTVVPDGEVKNENREISLTDAREIDSDYEVDEEVSENVDFASFGRRAILTLRQTLASKILELEHDSLYNKYKDRVGEIVSAEVYQVWKKEMLLVDDEGNELILPKTEQIPSDFYRKGEAARAVVARVDNTNNNPKIILSRTSPVYLQRLLEAEVPEIHDGLITIRKIARIPGERAKIAVESYDDRIDPVGACVGVKGSRVHGIVRELRGENIDVIPFTQNISLFITRALSPATVNSIHINEEERKAEVYLNPDQVSLAIGKSGLNIKLASMLTEYTIDVYREIDNEEGEDDDIYLDEFVGDIDAWVIESLKAIGMETAKDVMKAPREMLISRGDLEEETVDEVLRILKEEFEEE